MTASAAAMAAPLRIQLPDGPSLAAEHYACPPKLRQGTVLIRTPYERGILRAQAASWMRRGYDVIVQSVRGRYGSQGTWDPYCFEAGDGAATVRNLQERGLLAGLLVLAGASYEAHCALEAARALESVEGHGLAPAVIAMVPALGLHETAYALDGRPRLRDRIGWWHMHGFASTSQAPLDPGELDYRVARGQHEPIQDLMPAASYGEAGHRRWKALWSTPKLDLPARYGPCRAPLLVISGYHDYFDAEAISLAEAWNGGRTALLTGPWGHQLQPADPAAARALQQAQGLMAQLQRFLGNEQPLPWTKEFHPGRGNLSPWVAANRQELADHAHQRSEQKAD